MASPELINGVTSVNVIIRSIDLTTSSSNPEFVSAAPNSPIGTISKVVNLTVTNTSTTSSAGFTLRVLSNLSQTKGDIINIPSLGPLESLCLFDKSKPLYLVDGYTIRGFATANNTINTYCALEFYT